MNRFSQIYCKKNSINTDSNRFRVRLGKYLYTKVDAHRLASEIEITQGIIVPTFWNGSYDIISLVNQVEIKDILDIVTIVYNLIGNEDNHSRYANYRFGANYRKEFADFINTCFLEENLCYKVDENGIVHYSPDKEFNLLKVDTLKCLNSLRYQAVAKEFNLAYGMLDSNPPKTKHAIKAIFESLEILCKLLTNSDKSTSLNSDLIMKTIKPLLENYYEKDRTVLSAMRASLESFAKWVGAMHWYRHGQKTENPNDPPLDFTIFAISTGTSYLRWLTTIDSNIHNKILS